MNGPMRNCSNLFTCSFYGTLNALTICTLVTLAFISHARAAYFDPGFVPLPKKGLDFSDVQSNENSTALLKVDHCLFDVSMKLFYLAATDRRRLDG